MALEWESSVWTQWSSSHVGHQPLLGKTGLVLNWVPTSTSPCTILLGITNKLFKELLAAYPMRRKLSGPKNCLLWSRIPIMATWLELPARNSWTPLKSYAKVCLMPQSGRRSNPRALKCSKVWPSSRQLHRQCWLKVHELGTWDDFSCVTLSLSLL